MHPPGLTNFDAMAKYLSLKPRKGGQYQTFTQNYRNEPLETAKYLVFFETSKQRTYLVATETMVYIILDDTRLKDPKVNWSAKKADFVKMPINIKQKDEKIGHFDFGNKRKEWLFNKAFFEDNDLKNKIVELIMKTDGSHITKKSR